mmetsp:Transcript_11725/g.25033  ORF Transcript_11725/g.25033 Transcript_11725/m.25033 type:complete len:236 (+) Transcript_11725:103-810(+)
MASAEKVEFGAGLPGYVFGEKGKPGIVVLQEWWGITDEVKAQAESISKEGFRALIPDIYKGKLGVDMEEAGHLMSNLDFPAAVEEIKAAAAFLKAEGCPTVGATGFCMGGALTLLSVAQADDIACGVPFYGVPGGFDGSAVAKPVQGHFGALDVQKGFSDAETAKQLREQLKKGCAESEVFIYDGVGHAFMNADPTHPNIKEGVTVTTPFPGLNKEVQDLAFKRTIDFFKAHLSA